MEQVFSALLQVAVTLVGVVAPVVVERLRKPSNTGQHGPMSAAALGRKKPLLDLAVLLIYGAFLSAILSHSIIISGRGSSFSLLVLGGVTLITGVTGFVLYFAWRKGFGEMTAGAMSLAALVVLLIAPGNVTKLKEEQGLEAGLPLLLPVLTLTFATSVVVMYLFGNPLGRENQPRQRRIVGIALLFLALGTSFILGFDYVNDAVRSDLAPKFQGTDEQQHAAKDLHARIRALDPVKRNHFYQLASDTMLAPEYRSAYFTIRSQAQQWDDAVAKVVKERQAPATPQVDPAATPSDPVTDYLTENAPIANDATALSIRDAAAAELSKTKFFWSPTSDSDSAKATRERQISRLQFLCTMSRHVETLDQNELLSQINERLSFVHAAPLSPRFDQLLLPMPGTDVLTRYQGVDRYRVKRFADLRKRLWPEETFDYQPYQDRSLDLAMQAAALEAAGRTPANGKAQVPIENVIFPRSLANTDPNFALQLALPRKEESYVHYRAATTLAARQLNKEDAEVVADFNKLPVNERWAIAEFLAPREHEKDLTLLTQLANAANRPTTTLSTADTRYDVAQRLEHDDRNACADSNESEICRWLFDTFSASDRKQIAELIQQPDRNGVSVTTLFASDVLEFIRKNAAHRSALDVIADPIAKAVEVIVSNKSDLDWLPKVFDDFKHLTPENRQGLLWHMAVTMYRGDGDFSLPPLPLLAVEAHSWSPAIAFTCAMLLMLPGTVGSIALAGLGARKLVERDRTRALVDAENVSGQLAGDIGLPVDLLGRESLLDRIRKLGGRGWSTIAVVGRRGIGKSRLLYELFKPSNPANAAAVSVWIPAPTSYDEGEFVESVFERLALRTERAVADQLQAKPLAVRLLERRQAQVGVWMFVTAAISLVILLAVAQERTFRPDLKATWVPILILATLAMATLVRFLASEVQPIDLTSWLERDRSRGASAVLLYREARAALTYLGNRRARAEGLPRIALKARVILMSLLVFIVSYVPLAILADPNWMLPLAISIGLAAIAAAFAARISMRPAAEHAGSSVMSLTANYRRFAATVVHHVEAGALDQQRGVMICIDELDKVIDEDAVRDFLRRMKGIFEVPGVYYYISLAEDTLARLYLASAQGKNEIDSSLDHIVRAQPLTFEDSEKLVQAYAKRLGFSSVDERLSVVIAAVSFGVPRDIIRRCDEVVSNWVGQIEGRLSVPQPAAVARAVRLERVLLAAEREGWARQIREGLSAEAEVAATFAAELFNKFEDEAGRRVIALLWTLSMCEVGASAKKGKSEFWSQIYRFGYDLPVMPLSDLATAIDEISSPPTAPPEPPPARRPRFHLQRAQQVFGMTGAGENGSTRTPL